MLWNSLISCVLKTIFYELLKIIVRFGWCFVLFFWATISETVFKQNLWLKNFNPRDIVKVAMPIWLRAKLMMWYETIGNGEKLPVKVKCKCSFDNCWKWNTTFAIDKTIMRKTKGNKFFEICWTVSFVFFYEEWISSNIIIVPHFLKKPSSTTDSSIIFPCSLLKLLAVLIIQR